MKQFTITPPNKCGLVVTPIGVVYSDAVGAIIYVKDGATFEEFLTPEEAAVRAKALDPEFDVDLKIHGISKADDLESQSPVN